MLDKYQQVFQLSPPRPEAVIFLVSSGCFLLRSNSLSLIMALPPLNTLHIQCQRESRVNPRESTM